MPAKKQITKNKILEEAYYFVREKGMEHLNMRELAHKCNCSTQPIYLAYKGIDELKQDISKKCYEEFYKFIENEMKSGKYPEYKAIGMGYIRFAIEYTEIFKYLFMRNRNNKADNFEQESFDKSIMIIMKNYGLYKDDATTLHAEMWVFVHGIATMFATGYLDWDWDTVSKMVSDVYLGLTLRLHKGDKNDN